MKIKLPPKIRLEASTYCQLDCPGCPRTTPAFKSHIGLGFLSFSDFRTLIDANPHLRAIELSNYGEIFLNPELSGIIEYAYDRQLELYADNGVNLNNINPALLEGMVRLKMRSMTCSIDGASQDTYQLYRVGGDFERVIDNIRRINAYKKLYNSPYPALNWQYIVFGYNEHQIAAARALANDLGMNFNVKLSWNPELSPVTDIESVRLEVGAADRKEYRQLHGHDYAASCCEAMWDHPQINWDGRILGCPRNFWGDFGANVFTNGLYKAVNSQQIRYARAMLHGWKPSRQDIPCSSCDLYLDMKATGRWFKHTHNSWLSRVAHSICQSFRSV